MEGKLDTINEINKIRDVAEGLRMLHGTVPTAIYAEHIGRLAGISEKLLKENEALQAMQRISENMQDALQSYVGQPESVERLREAATRLAKEESDNIQEQVVRNIWKRWQSRNTELGRATFMANAASDINILLEYQRPPIKWKLLQTNLKHAVELERYDSEEFTFPPCEMSDEQAEICNEWLSVFMEAVEKNVLGALEDFISETSEPDDECVVCHQPTAKCVIRHKETQRDYPLCSTCEEKGLYNKNIFIFIGHRLPDPK